MIVYPVEEDSSVKRDMDLVRDLLLRLEQDPNLDGTKWIHFTPADLEMAERSPKEIGYHLTMLIEEGFVKGKAGFEAIPIVFKLTWQGHELLDSIRDPDIWSKTKKRIEGLASVSLKVVFAIAEAEIKRKLGLA
jgi:hypothetical protein